MCLSTIYVGLRRRTTLNSSGDTTSTTGCSSFSRSRRWPRNAISTASAEQRELNEQVEGPAQKSLARLLSGERIDQEQRKVLALYFLVTWIRVPRMRARMESWIPEMKAKALAPVGLAATEADERNAEEMLRSAIKDVPVSQKLAAEIEALKWTLVKARHPDYFVTSDCPLYRGERRGNSAKITELVLPLSPSTALICQKQGRREGFSIVYASPEMLRKIRRYVISVPTRYVFSHVRAEWIEDVAQEERKLRIEEDELFAHLRPAPTGRDGVIAET